VVYTLFSDLSDRLRGRKAVVESNRETETVAVES
jgi:hypothetical protein